MLAMLDLVTSDKSITITPNTAAETTSMAKDISTACRQFIGNKKYQIGSVRSGLDDMRRFALYRENGAKKTECAACVFKSRCRNSCGCKNYAATGSLSSASPSMCAHEQTLIPIADDLAKRLLRNKYATFLRKPYDDFHSFRPEAEWAALRMV